MNTFLFFCYEIRKLYFFSNLVKEYKYWKQSTKRQILYSSQPIRLQIYFCVSDNIIYINRSRICKNWPYLVIFPNIWQLFISIFQLKYFAFSSFVWYVMVSCNRFIFKHFAPKIWLLLKARTNKLLISNVLIYFTSKWNSVAFTVRTSVTRILLI